MSVTVAALIAGCYHGQDTTDQGYPDGASSSELQPAGLDAVFEAAGAEFDVPAGLLKAVAWAETRWHMVHADDEGHPHGADPAYGVMALRGERLHEGAGLAGVDLDEAQNNVVSNIRAAAAWFSAHADRLEIEDRDDFASWAEVIADYGGLDNPTARNLYVNGDVFEVIREGFTARTADGLLQGALDGADFDIKVHADEPDPLAASGPDYPDSIWRPSPNNSSRPGGTSGDIQMIIIHSCEGSYAGCWSWLTQSASGVSAHYVVNSTGSEISQLVRESRKAWHIGASYNCSLNDSTLCNLNGVGSNGFTVGIEHAGFASQSSWDSGLIDSSAQLACDISEQYGIPRDANHIVAHGQLQSNRTDPGANWPWSDYIDLVRFYCGDITFSEIIVDSNDNNNDPSVADMDVSANWTGSAGTPGYWGTGYWFSTTQPISDGANFWFYLDQPGSHSVDAWWTQGSNRSPAAPFLAYNASGSHQGTVTMNQQTGGSQWNEIGTFNFTAGWNRISLSRWAASGYVVIADAVRIR